MKTTKHIPKFKSAAEERKFWETHSVTEFEQELKEARDVKFPKPCKRLISLRMDDPMIKSLKEVAAQKGIGYLTLVRMWVTEKLSKERKAPHPHHA